MRIRAAWLGAALAALLLDGCASDAAGRGVVINGGDSRRGSAAILRYGCGSCHTIRGIRSAHGLVGPPLTGLKNRMYIAGMLPNTPENLMTWVRDPKAVNPGTAMPKLGVSAQDSADIAAYIYTVR